MLKSIFDSNQISITNSFSVIASLSQRYRVSTRARSISKSFHPRDCKESLRNIFHRRFRLRLISSLTALRFYIRLVQSSLCQGRIRSPVCWILIACFSVGSTGDIMPIELSEWEAYGCRGRVADRGNRFDYSLQNLNAAIH